MGIKYIVCYLKDGTMLNFDKKCKRVGPLINGDNRLLNFLTKTDTCLGIIPTENILYVSTIEE